MNIKSIKSIKSITSAVALASLFAAGGAAADDGQTLEGLFERFEQRFNSEVSEEDRARVEAFIVEAEATLKKISANGNVFAWIGNTEVLLDTYSTSQFPGQREALCKQAFGDDARVARSPEIVAAEALGEFRTSLDADYTAWHSLRLVGLSNVEGATHLDPDLNAALNGVGAIPAFARDSMSVTSLGDSSYSVSMACSAPITSN